MDDQLDQLTDLSAGRQGRVSWGSVVGAAFGLAVGVIGFRWGWGAALLGAVLALVGGFLGRLYVGENTHSV